jgi:anti-sigma-K factor RskA
MEAGVHELTAAYALDALDPDERREYEQHLAGCESCRDELASFWETTEALAVAATGAQPSAAPSDDLRDRILTAARAERQVVVPFEPRRRSLAPVLGAAAAVAAVIALGIGLWAAQTSSDLDSARSALERERAATAVLADPAARTVALEAGAGRLVVAEDGRATLILHNLPPAPAGMTYELWIVEGETPKPAGLFPGSDDPLLVALDGTVEPGNTIAVTIEDAGGAQVPQSNPIITSEPA